MEVVKAPEAVEANGGRDVATIRRIFQSLPAEMPPKRAVGLCSSTIFVRLVFSKSYDRLHPAPDQCLKAFVRSRVGLTHV